MIELLTRPPRVALTASADISYPMGSIALRALNPR